MLVNFVATPEYASSMLAISALIASQRVSPHNVAYPLFPAHSCGSHDRALADQPACAKDLLQGPFAPILPSYTVKSTI